MGKADEAQIMEIVQLDPAQIQHFTDLASAAVNAIVMAIACVCFFLGLNSWESSAK
jgi:hypothetical protein